VIGGLISASRPPAFPFFDFFPDCESGGAGACANGLLPVRIMNDGVLRGDPAVDDGRDTAGDIGPIGGREPCDSSLLVNELVRPTMEGEFRIKAEGRLAWNCGNIPISPLSNFEDCLTDILAIFCLSSSMSPRDSLLMTRRKRASDIGFVPC
jgi:hypothetical protein